MANWRDSKIEHAFLTTAVPVGLAPTGTMGANGALTSGTALVLTYSGGIWLYFPAGAVYSGSSAGFYWTVMSTTTAGTVFNTTLGATTPYIPSSTTAVVDAGPGAYTGHTAADLTLATLTIPANILGLDGVLMVTPLWSFTNSANNKTVRVKLGTTNFHSQNYTTLVSLQHDVSIRNRGVANKQVGFSITGTGYGTSTISVSAGTEDTATDLSLTIVTQRTTATENIVLEGFDVEILK